MEGYVTQAEAAALLGVSRWTLQERIRKAQLPVYSAPADHRRRLLRRADVEQLAQPQPVPPRQSAKGACS
jgi:excisionase family DNA binding protein